MGRKQGVGRHLKGAKLAGLQTGGIAGGFPPSAAQILVVICWGLSQALNNSDSF
jgi:hypothetical protein